MVHPLTLVVAATFATKPAAALVERKLKAWKNPTKAISFLQQLTV
jgi:predicted GIY-YIG superfamily endonuclease